jgi:hypothetical protein
MQTSGSVHTQLKLLEIVLVKNDGQLLFDFLLRTLLVQVRKVHPKGHTTEDDACEQCSPVGTGV